MNMGRIIMPLAAVLLISACASHDTKTINLNEPDAYTISAAGDGISVGVDVFDTDARTKASFDRKLVGEGIFPVQISVRNTGSAPILILQSQITLTGETVAAIRPMNAAEVAEEVENNAMANAIFGFGIFSYAAAKDANAERQADYANKAIPEEWIIKPGRLSGGFVFFQLPKGEKPAGRKIEIRVETLQNPMTEQTVEVQL